MNPTTWWFKLKKKTDDKKQQQQNLKKNETNTYTNFEQQFCVAFQCDTRFISIKWEKKNKNKKKLKKKTHFSFLCR